MAHWILYNNYLHLRAGVSASGGVRNSNVFLHGGKEL